MKTILLLLALLAGLAQAPPDLYLGDNVTGDAPGITAGQRLTVFHMSDAILSMEEMGDARYGEIVLGLGTHAVQGSDKPYAGHPALFRLRYGRLLDTALARGETVIAVNIPWLNWLPEKVDRAVKWNGIINEEAAARGVCVVDAWAVMAACGMACISEDGYHPNAAGYALIACEVGRCRAATMYLPLVRR